MSDVNTPSREPADGPEQSMNQEDEPAHEARPDAIVRGVRHTRPREPEREARREAWRAVGPAVPDDARQAFALPWTQRPDEALPERDQTILTAVVLLRLLSYNQLHRLLFAGRDRSALRHRVNALATRGWLARWDRPRTPATSERYALPTPQTLDRALAAIRRKTDGTVHAPLVAHMLPKVRRPLSLAAANDPKWLQHQREVNDLVISIAATRRLTWASSWEAPFASKAGIVDLPQPDYVLVEEHDGGPFLTFGEHDRGNEPVDRFLTRKISAYCDLVRFPEALAEHCGIGKFRVDVSVLDVPRQRPVRRLIELLDAAASSSHPELFRFTLGGWLSAHPENPTWFSSTNPPQSESPGWDDHAGSRA